MECYLSSTSAKNHAFYFIVSFYVWSSITWLSLQNLFWTIWSTCNIYLLSLFIKMYINFFFCKCCTRIRLFSHSLHIESCRFHGIRRNNRHCAICNLNVIKDKTFNVYYMYYVKKKYRINTKTNNEYYRARPSVFLSLVQLLSVKNCRQLVHLGKKTVYAYNIW